MEKVNLVIISQNKHGVEPNITKLYLSSNDSVFMDMGGENFGEYVKEQVQNVLSMYNHSVVITEDSFDSIHEIEAEETEVEY